MCMYYTYMYVYIHIYTDTHILYCIYIDIDIRHPRPYTYPSIPKRDSDTRIFALPYHLQYLISNVYMYAADF
jgi:hypothetical protein